ncbi:unnamed protein product [Microthlaspi erraticum]|uniref:Uncharacterized protein n=1 Tax=Microthlaspi erraticum TaxID=1685480 RepID=A0A6D2KDM7_9BRAS|nr:unnamed protein product [Microthlaspi erraticum]
MEESDAEEYVYSEEESEKESDGSPSEEEGEEVNQEVHGSEHESNQDEPWRRLSHKRRKKNSPCTKSTTMLSSPWTLWNQVPTC